MDDTDLLIALGDLRRKLREANRERGRTSLTLHLTRLERDTARARARKAVLGSIRRLRAVAMEVETPTLAAEHPEP